MSRGSKPIPAAEHNPRDRDLERLIFLSDGVFAIALTLLALELKPPEAWNGRALDLLVAMSRPLMAFGFSFLSIAFYWAGHRRTFRHIIHADRVMTVLNFLSLGLVTLLPIVTRMFIEQGQRTEALYIYLGVIASIGISNGLIWGYAAIRPTVMDPAVPRRVRIVQFAIMLVIPATTALFVVLSAESGSGWPWMFMLPVWAGVVYLRRWAGKDFKI